MSDKESFQAFKNSFFYGSRSDLSFKFLEHMDEEEAAEFLQRLFRTIIDSLDHNNPDLLRRSVIEGQVAGYARQSHFAYESGPFTPFDKKVSQATLTLITSSGHFVKDDDPQPFGVLDMSQEEAEKRIFEALKEIPALSKIPFTTQTADLNVRHGGYDVRAAQMDANVNFPWQRLAMLQQMGIVGRLTEAAYSFVGACSQKRLINQVLPEWVEKIKATGADAALLVPV